MAAVIELLSTVGGLAGLSGASADIVFIKDQNRTSGNPFYFNPTGTTWNNGTSYQITAAGGGTWEMQHDGSICVAWFGAAGNGMTDDYGPIKAVVNYANANPELVKEIMFGAGKDYFIQGPPNIPVGQGIDPRDLNFSSLQNVVIRGNGATLLIEGRYGVSATYMRRVRLSFELCADIIIDNFRVNTNRQTITPDPTINDTGANGFTFLGCNNIKILNCLSLLSGTDGFHFTSAEGRPCSIISMVNSRADFSARDGIRLGAVNQFTATNSVCAYSGQDYNLQTGAVYPGANGVTINPASEADGVSENMLFQNCKCVANKDAQFECGDQVEKYKNIVVDGCYFTDTEGEVSADLSTTFGVHFASVISVVNYQFDLKRTQLSLAGNLTPEQNLNTQIIFDNNRIICGTQNGGNQKSIVTGENLASISVTDNHFVQDGSGALTVDAFMELQDVQKGFFKDNYTFIPSSRFNTALTKNLVMIAKGGWLISQSVIQTNFNNLDDTSYFFTVEVYNAAALENITLLGGNPGFDDAIRAFDGTTQLNHDTNFPLTFLASGTSDNVYEPFGRAMNAGEILLIGGDAALTKARKIMYGNNPPPQGISDFNVGDILFNNTPVIYGNVGWIYLGGVNGWIPFGISGAIQALASANVTPNAPTSYSQSQVQTLLDELRDLKNKLQSANLTS